MTFARLPLLRACVFYFILLYSTGGDYTLRILFHSFVFFY